MSVSSQLRHNGVSNHQPRDYLLNRLFMPRSNKTSKLRVTGLFCREITGHRWISRTNGQWRGECFHLMTSSWAKIGLTSFVKWVTFKTYPIPLFCNVNTWLLLFKGNACTYRANISKPDWYSNGISALKYRLFIYMLLISHGRRSQSQVFTAIADCICHSTGFAVIDGSRLIVPDIILHNFNGSSYRICLTSRGMSRKDIDGIKRDVDVLVLLQAL